MSIEQEEYEQHKQNCGKNFGDVFQQIDRLNRGVFGEPDLKRKGMLEMTSAMYDSFVMARGGEKMFFMFVKIAGAILTIGSVFTGVYFFIKSIVK